MKKLFAILLLLFVFPAFAAGQSPEAFLDSIYVHYQDDPGQALGVPLSSEETIRKYFTPELADMIVKDDAAAAARNEVPLLDGDPFVDAQEWEISSFDIRVNKSVPGKADASVTFTNFAEEKVVTVLLVELSEGWRIDDIKWNSAAGSLRGLYTAPAKE